MSRGFRFRVFGPLLLFLLLIPFTIHAGSGSEQARDISQQCSFNGYTGSSHALTDGTYARDVTLPSLRITAPEGETIGALYIQWYYPPDPMDIQVFQNDQWETVLTTEALFYAEYIELPGLTGLRLVKHDNPNESFRICEMKVLTPGTPPDDVQLWQTPGDKVDMLLFVGHPDDEVLWFGGLLPYYAGELNKNVLVICSAMNRGMRRLELLDCLWACGVRTHPIHCKLFDFSTTDIKQVLSKWGGEEYCKELYTGFIRKYKPDVLVLHDVNGEYGHGIHKANCWLGQNCAELAEDPEAFPDQAAELGTWQIPKVYIHLYTENEIQMDWHVPLSRFGGKTAIRVAQEAMEWHKSQVSHNWKVEDHGQYDNSFFGLYRSTVGPDLLKNDFFENIE